MGAYLSSCCSRRASAEATSQNTDNAELQRQIQELLIKHDSEKLDFDPEEMADLEKMVETVEADLQGIMKKKCWDNVREWMGIDQDIHAITYKLKSYSELQRSYILNTDVSMLSQILMLLTTKGYMKKSREPMWGMVEHLIKQGMKPTSDDMKMIYYEYTHIYNKQGALDYMIGQYLNLTKKILGSDEVLSLLTLKLNPDDNSKLEYHMLNGGITLDQISVAELRVFIQNCRIDNILFGINQFGDDEENNMVNSSFMVHPIHEYELIQLFLREDAILHKCFLYDGHHVSDMHVGILLSWLYIVRILYHETPLIISQKIRELEIIDDDLVNIIMDYIHHDTYLKFTKKYNEDKFFELAMIYMVDFVYHLSVDKQNWKQFIIDNIWNKLSLEQISMIRSNELLTHEAYEIWCTLEDETDKVYKEISLKVFDINSNPQKSMKDRPNV